MTKWVVFAAALLLGTSSAIAQTSSTNPSTPGGANAPAATTGGATTPSRSLSGTSTPNEAQIKQKLEAGGYSQIQLHENATDQWSGTAMKNGHQVNIHVTPDGSVVEK